MPVDAQRACVREKQPGLKTLYRSLYLGGTIDRGTNGYMGRIWALGTTPWIKTDQIIIW